MATDIVLFEGEKFGLGFDNVLTVKLIRPSEIKKAKEPLQIFISDNEDDTRGILESRKADILLVGNKRRKDFNYQRASGLNHVLCSLAYRNDVAIAFSFSSLLKAMDKPLLLGRMIQNVRLCRKYKVKMVLASFASDKWEMRAYYDLLSFGKTIGMNPKEAKESLNAAEAMIENKKLHIREGVKRA